MHAEMEGEITVLWAVKEEDKLWTGLHRNQHT